MADYLTIPLKPILQAICENTLSEVWFSTFIRLCIRFSVVTLKMQAQKGYRVLEVQTGDDSDWELVAIETLSELFRRDADYQFVKLQSYFKPLLEKNPTEEDCLIAVRKLIVNRTRQGLFDLFQERDPEGAKIWRNIQIAVEKNPNMQLLHRPKGQGICFIVNKQLTMKTVQYLDGELDPIIHEIIKPKDTIPDILQQLYYYLKESGKLPAMVFMNHLVYLIKSYHHQITKSEHQGAVLPEKEYVAEFSASDLRMNIMKVLPSIYEQVDQYVRKNKINSQEADTFKKALSGLANDWQQGEKAKVLFCYLKNSQPELSDAYYQNHLRTKFEYMVKLFREKISQSISDEEVNAGSIK